MSIELGRVDVLGADAIGQPGQRRFCLFARSWRGSALMWMSGWHVRVSVSTSPNGSSDNNS